jgi:hypothetical protein
VLLQRPDGGRCGVLRRVEECEVSIEDEVLLVIASIARGLARGLYVLRCDRQHAETIPAEMLIFLAEFVDASVIHRREHTIELEGFAAREDRLGSALLNQPEMPAVWRRMIGGG